MSNFTYNGVVYTSYQANEYLETPQGPQGAAALRATGANFASVLATQYMQTSTSNVIALETPSTPGYNSSADPLSPTDSAISAAISNLQAQGLTVVMKPQVDSLDGVFRGNFAPSNPTAWFTSYQTFILHYAQLAVQNNVGYLIIGTELATLSGSTYKTTWDNLIAQIRAQYPSLTLIYGANATGSTDEFTKVSFWDKVDIIGVDGYFPLTNQANPTVAQLVAAWTDNKSGFNIVNALKTLQSTYNKPLIFTELGYVSAPGTNETPYASAAAGAAYDPTEQANCYEAFFEVFSQQSAWMKGVFWWAWSVSPPGTTDTGYTPQNKPAANTILPKWFGATAPGFTLAAANPALTVGQGLNATDSIAVTGLGGFNGAVTLAATGLPSGVTASFAAGTGSGAQVLTLASTSATATGPATITVTGTSGALTASTTVSLAVQAPQLQTVAFANPGNQTEGTTAGLSATASSGLVVSFASSTPTVCTTNGTTATFLTAGTCTVTASQPGNSIYSAAMPVGQSFTVGTLASTPVPVNADVVVTQLDWLDALSGYVQTSNNATGGSFAVNTFGEIAIADTNNLTLINSQTGTPTTLGGWSGISAVSVDSGNNLYFGSLYSAPNNIVKLPYVGGATNGGYAAFTTPASTLPVCGTAGIGNVECLVTQAGSVTPGATIVDAKGDLFWINASTGTTGGNGIYECTIACLGGTGAPVLLYQEPTAATAPSASSGQLLAGGLAIDPSGNLFFTDSSAYVNTSTYAYTSFSSSLKELPVSTAVGYNGVITGYAAGPSVLYNVVPGTPGTYDNELDAVAVNATTGTVYFADESDGIYAFPNTGGLIPVANGQPTALYAVSPQGAKDLTIDIAGNLYLAASSTALKSGSADTVAEVHLGNLALPTSPVGTAAGTPTYNASTGITAGQVFAVVNDGAAAPALAVTASENGQPAAEFSAAAGAYSTLLIGKAFPLTVAYTPAKVGQRSAVLTVTDTASGGGVGTTTAAGVGQGALLTLDPGVETVYAAASTVGFNPADAIRADPNGNLFVGSGTSLFEIPAGSAASVVPTQIATGFGHIADLAFDPNGDLYLADSINQAIVEIPNVNGALVPASQTTVIPHTALFGSAAIATPTSLAFGPDGLLYIADAGTGNVDTFNPTTGTRGVRVAAVIGINGIAIDAGNSLYIATAGTSGQLLVYSGGALTTTALGNVLPRNIALDASGSAYLPDQTSGKILRVPSESGVLNYTDAVDIETLTGAAGPLAIGADGSLYGINSKDSSVHAFTRTGAAVNYATSIAAGSTSAALALYPQNAGNVPLTTLAVSTPTGPFTVAAGTPACGATLAVGTACQELFTFAPAAGATGAQTGAAVVTSNAPAATVTLAGSVATALTAQTITFANPGAGTVGTPLTLTATASSGLAVTFTSATAAVCTVSGTAVTLLTPGTCTLDANQAGNSSFAAATQVSQSFTVSGAPSFTLAPTAAAVPLTLGASAMDTVNVTAANGFTGSVTLAASGLPSGITATFATNPTTGSSVVNFTAGATAVTGPTTVTVTGTSGTLTASTTIALTVSAAPSFSLAVTPSTLPVAQGGTATGSVAVTAANGFASGVTLTATGLPSGVTLTFATNPATRSSGFTITAGATAAVGSSTVTITGTSGTLNAASTFTLTVQAPAIPPTPPTLDVLPASSTVSVTPGTPATEAIAVSGSGGFVGTVTLSAAVTSMPAGATSLPTVSFGTTGSINVTAAGGGTATLTISTTAPTSAALRMPGGKNTSLAMACSALLACLLLVGMPGRRRLPKLLPVLLLLAAFAGTVGCGGGSSSTPTTGGSPGTTPGAYVITVTAVSGSTTVTVPLAVTVQ